MIPTKDQWKRWSLPSKLTAIGAYVGIVSLVLTIVSFWPARSKDPEIEHRVPSDNLVIDPQLTSHRIALVIGVENYDFLPAIRNALISSREIERTLERLGFQIIACPDDPSRDTLIRCIHDFQKILGLGGVGVFYFGGHGIQIAGENYLLARDASPRTEGEVKSSALNIDLLLAPVDRLIKYAPKNSGTVVVYSMACSSGEEKELSPFVRNLVPLIQRSNLEFSNLFRELRVAVMNQTNNQQIPWMSTSFQSNFHFQPSEKEDIGVLKMLIFDACRTQQRWR